jgi:glycosyltransferase involved in cell wall biosynthesis
MRVLLLDYEYPPLTSGGAPSEALARGFASRGITVDLVTSGERPSTESSVLGDGAPSAKGLLTVHRVKSRAGYLFAALRLLRLLLRGERYDLVHVVFSPPTGALLGLLDFGDAPIIISLQRRDNFRLDSLNRWICHRADRLVAASDSLGEAILRGSPRLRYSVVHNGVDLDLFHPARMLRRIRAGRVRCLLVAPLTERARVADLIHALALLERGRFELEIVGTGPEEPRLRALAVNLGVVREVMFRGPLSRAALAERYREADLFTSIPSPESTDDGFAEALASGLPVVGSSVGAIPEIVEQGNNGLLVRPGDVRAIADAIARLGANPQLRREMGRRNRLKAKATLDWSRITERYLSIYAGVQRRLAPARPAGIPSSTW